MAQLISLLRYTLATNNRHDIIPSYLGVVMLILKTVPTGTGLPFRSLYLLPSPGISRGNLPQCGNFSPAIFKETLAHCHSALNVDNYIIQILATLSV